MDRLASRLRAGLLLLLAISFTPFQPAQAEEGTAGQARPSSPASPARPIEGGQPVIDLNGTVGSILDLRHPGTPPQRARNG